MAPPESNAHELSGLSQHSTGVDQPRRCPIIPALCKNPQVTGPLVVEEMPLRAIPQCGID